MIPRWLPGGTQVELGALVACADPDNAGSEYVIIPVCPSFPEYVTLRHQPCQPFGSPRRLKIRLFSRSAFGSFCSQYRRTCTTCRYRHHEEHANGQPS